MGVLFATVSLFGFGQQEGYGEQLNGEITAKVQYAKFTRKESARKMHSE